MKKILVGILGLLSLNVSAQFKGYNMIQLGRWDNDSLTSLDGQQFSNLWGWADSATGREYAIMGSVDSTYFIDVTLPWAPKVCDVKAGRVRRSVWREYKTYRNYCYAVGDYGPTSLQVFDLSYLPDSVHTVYDSDSVISRSHTIYIDGDRLYCNSVVTKTGQTYAASVLSLADPENPVLMGHLIPPVFDGSPAFVKCHDAFIRNDTFYCSGENAGVFIYNYANPANPVLIGTITDYPERGYNHSSYVSDDGEILVFTDETSGIGIKAYDISNFSDFELQSVFRSNPGAIAHNPYFIGRTLYVSYYHDGVYVFDMNDPKRPRVIAWYDTYPDNEPGSYSGFEGCWGVYPFLPSGNILASDMTNGLFILRMDAGLSVGNEPAVTEMKIQPNPAGHTAELIWESVVAEPVEVCVLDLKGRELKRVRWEQQGGRNNLRLDLSDIQVSGVLMVQLKGLNTHICRKLIKY